ncbi:MAG: glycosyltransferase family 39 protein [Cyanobacteria bacterium J06636_16]
MRTVAPPSAGTTAISSDRYRWVPIGLILLLAAGLYFYDLGGESLWIDELISIDRAKAHNLELLRVRPLSYFLLHVWMWFGTSDAWLRGQNVLFSLGTIVLTYHLAQRLAGQTVALTASLILALSPLAIHHAQEVRMYTPSIFFGVLGTLIFVHALEQPKLAWIGAWSIARWLAILTTPLNLLLLLPDTVLFAWMLRSRPKMLYRFIGGLLLVGVLWLPWLITVASASARFMGGVEVAGAAAGEAISSEKRPGFLAVIFQTGRFTAWPFGRPNSNAIHGFYQVYSVLMACVLAFAVLTKRWRSSRLMWVTAWTFLPLVPIFLVSQISRSLWVDRYLVFTAPYCFILLAAGMVEIWRRQRWGAIAIALIYLVAISGGIKRYYTVLDRKDWRGLVATIAQNEQPGDLIVWSMNQSIPRALNHYYQGSADIEVIKGGHTVTASEESVDVSKADERIAAANWLAQLPEERSRIWLAYSETSPTFLSVLEQQFEIEKHRSFDDSLQIFLLKPRSFD